MYNICSICSLFQRKGIVVGSAYFSIAISFIDSLDFYQYKAACLHTHDSACNVFARELENSLLSDYYIVSAIRHWQFHGNKRLENCMANIFIAISKPVWRIEHQYTVVSTINKGFLLHITRKYDEKCQTTAARIVLSSVSSLLSL